MITVVLLVGIAVVLLLWGLTDVIASERLHRADQRARAQRNPR